MCVAGKWPAPSMMTMINRWDDGRRPGAPRPAGLELGLGSERGDVFARVLAAAFVNVVLILGLSRRHILTGIYTAVTKNPPPKEVPSQVQGSR